MPSRTQFIDARHRESGAGWPVPWLIAGVPGAGPGPPAVTAGRPLIVPPGQYPDTPDAWLQPSQLPITQPVTAGIAPTFVDARHRETFTTPSWVAPPPRAPFIFPPSKGSVLVSYIYQGDDDSVTVIGAGVIDSRLPVIKALVVDHFEPPQPPSFFFRGSEGIPAANTNTPPLGNYAISALVEDKTNIQAWVMGPSAGNIVQPAVKLPWGTVVVPSIEIINQPPFAFMFEGGPNLAELNPSRGNAVKASSFDDAIDRVVPAFTFPGSQWINPRTSPIPPPGCVAFWSADGRNGWTADGFPGWSADGYEPTPLVCAQGYLAGIGINIGTITYVYSQTVPLGWVITGYPGRAVGKPVGSYLNLLVSNGPAPSTPVTTVPNVVGLYYYEAQLAILDASLRIAPPIWVLSSTVRPGYVISQSLAPLTQVNQQTQMTITVSGFPIPIAGKIVPQP